jgi:hypothetical protein
MQPAPLHHGADKNDAWARVVLPPDGAAPAEIVLTAYDTFRVGRTGTRRSRVSDW